MLIVLQAHPQQAALVAAAASQGAYLAASPVSSLAHMAQVGGLPPNGISTPGLTPTTMSLANGKVYHFSKNNQNINKLIKCS